MGIGQELQLEICEPGILVVLATFEWTPLSRPECHSLMSQRTRIAGQRHHDPAHSALGAATITNRIGSADEDELALQGMQPLTSGMGTALVSRPPTTKPPDTLAAEHALTGPFRAMRRSTPGELDHRKHLAAFPLQVGEEMWPGAGAARTQWGPKTRPSWTTGCPQAWAREARIPILQEGFTALLLCNTSPWESRSSSRFLFSSSKLRKSTSTSSPRPVFRAVHQRCHGGPTPAIVFRGAAASFFHCACSTCPGTSGDHHLYGVQWGELHRQCSVSRVECVLRSRCNMSFKPPLPEHEYQRAHSRAMSRLPL